MFHVLEHVPDPRAYLVAARDLLAPDGRLVVQVPNAASWQFRLLGRRWSGVDVPRHLYDFRDRDVGRLLEECGMAVVRHKYFSLRDNPAGLASSVAPWRGACGGWRRLPARGWPRTWHTWRWRRRRCRLRWRRRPSAPARR
jgi:SAM-dependent methyltransferase